MCAPGPHLCPILATPLWLSNCDPHSNSPNRRAVLESCFFVELTRMSAIIIARPPSRYRSGLQEGEAEPWVSVSV